tara:strand:+ start:50 stop:1057 length:1008 start_codon:yes stop_codon:yes gene_type:complete
MNRLLNCLNNKSSGDTPVWFMRQAGRYLPEFMEIRKENTDFVKLCLNSDLAKEITIQPIKRFDLDAAIIFSDILMIPYGLGQNVNFKKGFGPQLDELQIDISNKVNNETFTNNLKPVYEAIKKVRIEIEKKSLIGFVGAPWTLFLYMINRQSPKKNFNFEEIIKNNTLTKELYKKLEEIICLHIKNQVDAGANIIQVFDSWAGLLPENQLKDYCYEPTKRIVEFVKKLNIPVICFPRGIGKNYEDFCSSVKPDCISIDYEVDPNWIKQKIKTPVIQGGLDPKVLLKNKEDIKKEVKKYLDIFRDKPYIFNLGHGVLPETKPEIIKFVTSLVREYK